MKEKLTDILLFIISITAIIWGAYTLGKGNKEVEYIERYRPHDIYLTDVIYDTIYLTRYDTLEYYNYDTIFEAGDIVLITDTLEIPVPITAATFDTTIITDDYKTQITGQISGFHTSLDLLTINTEITRQEAKKRLKLAPAIGLGYGTGGFGIFAGIGITK